MPDLEELYREIILDHYRSPRNRGELPSPPAHRVEGYNPLCGDEVVLSLVVEDGRLADIKVGGTGCSISQSSASLMSSAVKGKPLSEVHDLIRTFKSLMSVHEATLDDPISPAEAAKSAGTDRSESGSPAAGSAPGPAIPAVNGNGSAGAAPANGPGLSTVETVVGEPEPVDLASLGELAALQGVVKFPVRIKCATLSWNALAQGLGELGSTPV